jgi:hypothetical protein
MENRVVSLWKRDHSRSAVQSFSIIVVMFVEVSLASAFAHSASAEPRGVFVVHCAYSHSLPDDPIVHPGEPGASHLHDFFANTTTDADSTVREMTHGRTTCLWDRDTSGYWFPAASVDGVTIVPTFSKTYYFGVPLSRVDRIPKGLQIVAGNASATSAAENPHASWSCGADGPRRTPIVDHPYDCTRFAHRWSFVDGVVGRVELPSCWDGAGTGTGDVAYLVDRACPSGFNHRLPTIHMQFHLGILDPCSPRMACRSGGAGGNVILALSSGPYYTLHADFWNTWQQRSLHRLIARCLTHHVGCGLIRNT